MKQGKALLVVFALLACCWQIVGQDSAIPEKDRKVTAVYDAKTDTTVVRFGPMHIFNFTTGSPFSYPYEDGELRLSGFFTYKGKEFVKPQSIALLFDSVNIPTNRWELSKHKDLDIVADDGRWNIPNVHLVHSTGNDLFMDSLGVTIPCETFRRIANAKKVKLRLGDRQFDFTKTHLTALRDLADQSKCQ